MKLVPNFIKLNYNFNVLIVKYNLKNIKFIFYIHVLYQLNFSFIILIQFN